MRRLTCVMLLAGTVAGPAGQARAQGIELENRVAVQTEEVLVRPDQDWSVELRAPGREGDHVVLALQTRLHLPGEKGGGCNWVLRVLIGEDVLTESFTRPRLLNKAPFFDFAEGRYHFSWYGRGHDAWMTMFADTYEVDTAKTGQDTTFVFDLNDYVRPGESFRLRVQYAQPNLPAVLKADAPLAVREVVIGTLRPEVVAELRERLLSGDKALRVIAVRAEPDADEQPGEPPYEIAWSGRREDPRAQVSFEDLRGWKARAFGDAEVEVGASRAQRIWRERVMRVRLGEGKNATVELIPPEPIPVPADANAVNCWVHSNYAYGRSGGPVHVTATVVDARGVCADLSLGALRGDYWEMRQGLLAPTKAARLRPPLAFLSLSLSGAQIQQPTTTYVESLAFFRRERKPYTRLGRLTHPPFPTSEDNMLPPAPQGCRAALAAGPGGRGAVFTATGAGDTVRYAVDPTQGALAGVTARVGDGPEFRPMAGGGLRIAAPGGTVRVSGDGERLLDSSLGRGVLTTRWRHGEGEEACEYEVAYRLRGLTLVVDVSCPGGRAEGLSLGRVEGLADATALEVPYLIYDIPPGPRVAMGSGVFASVLVDWYHSNCTILETRPRGADDDEGGVAINSGTVYEPLTDGRRLDLRERVLVTVSREIHDTLPSVATPRSESIEDLAPDLFVMSSTFTPGYYHTLKRYGLEHVTAIHFAGIWWQRAGEGFAMRWRPRPQLSEKDVADYRADIRALGYKWGMLVNYTCFLPLNEYWDENLVALGRGGELADGWYGHYDTKPNAMAMLARTVGQEIRKRYPTDCVYLDVHTNWGGRAIDWEAGVEGGGTARGTILGNAEAIHEVHKQHTSLCSEGIRRWMYAGLADMDYAQWVGTQKPQDKPLLPDFDLLRIHPKQIGTAMGYSPTCFFSDEGLAEYNKDPGKGTAHRPFYHYVAATLAHGHSAMIGYGYFPALARTIHYYALLSGPQEDYLPDTVTDIAWFSEAAGGFVSTSEALRSGAREEGKLRVTYAGGQVVHVNYHPDRTWQLEVAGRQFLLPPYGWVLVKPGQILAYSALVEGRRVDYVDCPRYMYLNSGGEEGGGAALPATEGGITVQGAVFVRKGNRPVVIPCGDLGPWKSVEDTRYPVFPDTVLAGPPGDRGVGVLRINAARLLGKGEDESVTVWHRDEAGATVKTETMRAGAVQLTTSGDVLDYVLE